MEVTYIKSMSFMQHKQPRGFTIVELLIVIVVIAILAAISIVAYNGIQERANFTRAQSDLKSLNNVVLQYYAVNSSYPDTSGVWRSQTGSGDNYIPGVKPDFISVLPKDKVNSGSESYYYRSNGVDYKLIRHTQAEAAGGKGLPGVERSNNPLFDSVRATWAWGYSTSGGASW